MVFFSFAFLLTLCLPWSIKNPASKLSGAFWRQGGKRYDSCQLHFWNLNSTSNSPCRLSCQISANQREAETSANSGSIVTCSTIFCHCTTIISTGKTGLEGVVVVCYWLSNLTSHVFIGMILSLMWKCLLVNKHCKTRAQVNDVITNVISTNQHFASTFLMQIFKF